VRRGNAGEGRELFLASTTGGWGGGEDKNAEGKEEIMSLKAISGAVKNVLLFPFLPRPKNLKRKKSSRGVEIIN
jgi:hypothetical protein